MFGIKNRYLIASTTRLPEKGIVRWKFKFELNAVKGELKNWRMNKNLGALFALPSSVVISIWRELLEFNPNNMGDWSDSELKNLSGTKKIERKLVKMMVYLYGGEINEWGGYMASGATEANIFSAWMGRNLFEKKVKTEQICLIFSSLAHYSIDKAANVIGVKSFITPINRSSWVIDIVGLEKRIRELYKKGYKAFLVPLTLGYTQTGTNDNYQEITKLFKKIGKELNILFFVWLDAALNGLILPFTKKNFYPLKNSFIQTLCVDFHKAGMGVIPSGLILYKKSLIPSIERSMPYISWKDTTLIGSRSGIPAVASYLTMKMLGRKGFVENISKLQVEKEKFKRKVSNLFPGVEIIDDLFGIVISLVSKKKLPDAFISQHGLFAKKHRYVFTKKSELFYIYKAAFLFKKSL